ncbi:hypothetical protein QCF01_16915, partial [Staphylococcus aureus]|nr:hypothetical protein [Staphylococcus aureus]
VETARGIPTMSSFHGFFSLGGLLGAALGGFVIGQGWGDGQGALAVATDGRVAAIKRQGRMLAVREIPWTRVRSTAEGIIAEVEGRFGSVTLAGVDVLDIRRLKA